MQTKKSDKKAIIIVSVIAVTLALVFIPITYNNYRYDINHKDSISEETKDENTDKNKSEFDDMVLPTVVAHADVLDWSVFGVSSFEEDEEPSEKSESASASNSRTNSSNNNVTTTKPVVNSSDNNSNNSSANNNNSSDNSQSKPNNGSSSNNNQSKPDKGTATTLPKAPNQDGEWGIPIKN